MEASAPASVERRRWLRAACWGVVAGAAGAVGTHLYWLWTGEFHSQDGPAHLFAVSAMRRLQLGDDGLLATVFARNLDPDPNWITYPLLAAWLRANPPRVAELLLVSVLVVGLACALYYAVTARGHAVGPVAVAGIPVALGWSLHVGLYNFTASLALWLVVVGYYARVRERLDVPRLALLAVLLLLTYFSHPMSLLVALFTVGLLAAAEGIATWRATGSPRPLALRFGALLAAAAPAATLLVWFLLDPGEVVPRETPRGVWESFVGTTLFRWPVAAVSPGDTGWATALAWVTWVVVVVLLGHRAARRHAHRWDVLLVVPLVMGTCAIVLPDRMAGGTLVQPRLAIYALLALLLWIGIANAHTELAGWLGAGLGLAAVVVLFGLVSVRVDTYREVHTAVEEVAGVAGAVMADHTILGGVSTRAPTLVTASPLTHITDLVALRSGAVPVATLDAGSGYGPIHYRERFDPDPALRGYPRNRKQGRDATPQQFRNVARQYEQVTGVRIDYIVVVAYDIGPELLEEYDDVGFRLARRTPGGFVHLFQATSRVMPLTDAMERHTSPAAEHPPRDGGAT